MRKSATLLLLALGLALSGGAGVHAQRLTQVATIPLPGPPISQYGVLTIDQPSGLGFIGDKDNKAIVIFDTKTDSFVARVGGFVGLTKDGNTTGPNGVVVVNDGGELWVSDGDSTVKVVDLKSRQITATIATGGTRRANAMAYDPNGRIVIVANSNDDVPFLSLISTAPDRKILAKIPVPQSAENIERSVYHAPSGMFYTAIPVLAGDKSKGILAQTDAKGGKLVRLHELQNCHPHSLQVVSDATIFLGCSDAHGSNPKPGGNLGVFDIKSAELTAVRTGMGGNGSSDFDAKLGRYYHSTSASVLIVVDAKSQQLIEKMPTSAGARFVGINQRTSRIYLPTTAKDGPCGGCIVVYAPQ